VVDLEAIQDLAGMSPAVSGPGKDILYRKKSFKATQMCIQDLFSRFVKMITPLGDASENVLIKYIFLG